MKKIGIITIENCANFGACYQSLALYLYIYRRTGDCTLIDMALPTALGYKKSKKFKPLRLSELNIKGKIVNFIINLFGTHNDHLQFEKQENYIDFQKFNSQIYNKTQRYFCPDDLYQCPPRFDIYITGSDQVWNPELGLCNEPYFLTFAESSSTKISYGSSLGVTSLNDYERICLKKWLKDYKAISVREDTAKEILQNITGREVTKVLDPTFLLNKTDWMSLSIPISVPNKYILLFILEMQEKLIDYAKGIAKESGLDLIVVCQTESKASLQKLKSLDEFRNPGPAELLSYIQKAELVITNSFHGTVMSIILEANNFISYNPKSSRSDRIKSILSLLNLEEHLIPSFDATIAYEEIVRRRIHWPELKTILDEEISKSKKFLDTYIC